MYDPLKEPYPTSGQSYPSSYWAKDIELPVSTPLANDVDVDVAIIGAGFTGMSTALHLATDHQINACVLDANTVGWGSSGRNAGFVLAGTGRLSVLDAQRKWGNEVAQLIYQEFQQGVDTVSKLIELGKIDCDLTPGGYLKVAHKEQLVEGLFKQAQALKDNFADPIELIDKQRISAEFLNANAAYGGIYQAQCFGLNPLKLALGYHQHAQDQGVKVYDNSPVTALQKEGNKQVLYTPKGKVRANKVVIATNGWTGKDLHNSVKNRHLPVLSSIIVTRPLSAAEQKEIALRAGLLVMDTRTLKYYYRMLADGRILFGGRGAIEGKDEGQTQYSQRLLDALKQTFPQLATITIDYFWSGWVSVAYDDYPRIWEAEANSVYYAMGYCGSGVAFAAQSGKRLAQLIAGDNNLPALPYFQSPLPKFPFAPFRRLGLKAFYLASKFRDA
jgi:glycine/D-amino acid oxidase-like deaminating enzyme